MDNTKEQISGKEKPKVLGIEEQIRNSSCYGVAFDGTLSECKRCDVSQRCSARCKALAEEATIEVSGEPVIVQSYTPPDKKSSKSLKSDVKPPKVSKLKKTVIYDPNMPVLKNLSMEELKKLAIERKCSGLDVIEKITSPQIQRMRYIMNLKATYAIG